MAHRFRGGRKSERIMVKYSFSCFKNTAADPVIIDFDYSIEEVHSEQPPLHEADALVIDLGGEDEPQKRESLPVTITDTSSNEGILMIEHLRRIGGHPAEDWRTPCSDVLDDVGQERLQLDWQTHHNFQDSGIYAMRVMETIMGDVKTWKVGFESSEQKQESQITNLKIKYVAKMLTSNFNKERDTVKNEVATYFSMPNNVRATVLEKARVTRWDGIG